MAAFRFTVDNQGIGRLVFDLPGEKINKFSLPVLKELEGHLDAAAANPEIKLLAISSAKEGIFIAGADLHSFEPMATDPSHVEVMIETGHRVFNKLASLPFPSVALINGACLGGGMEMSLACTYRLASDHPKTLLGLPEVTLGIIPGWGGTQRMPRLVGLLEGLPLILTGKPVKANKAWKIKLIDALVAAEFFEARSEEFLKRCLTSEGRKQIAARRKLKGLKHLIFEANPVGRSFVFYRAEKDVVSKTKGHYPAPLVALKLIKETITLPLKEGLIREIVTFKKSVPDAFANAQHLINLFFVQEALKKDAGFSYEGKSRKIEAAGVIGAGIMGSGIAWLFTNKDIPVRMKDIDWTAVGKGMGAAYGIYAKMVKDRRLKSSEASLKYHKLSGSIDYSGFNKCDLVVEAAVESLELKHQILRELESVVSKSTIIGTNTSSLKVSDMSAVMQNPERLVGMHFFNPANKMPLVEIVASERTSPEVVVTAVDICRKLGKTPIIVKDCPGFLVNRIFVTGANEVMRLYEEGVNFHKLETIMLNFGMPMSPFILADEVGNDVGYKVSKAFEQAYGSRMSAPKIVTAMYEHKLLGKKSGKGFYIYEKNGKKRPNPEVEKLRQGVAVGNVSKDLNDTIIRERIFFIMINEAARCLEENVIENPSYLDMAMIMGIGFPPFRGGLLRYADSLGVGYVVDQLKRFQEQYGERFAPSGRLLEMAKQNKGFY